jgi:hypothetical protein
MSDAVVDIAAGAGGSCGEDARCVVDELVRVVLTWSPEARGCSDGDIDAAMDAVERVVMERLYGAVFDELSEGLAELSEVGAFALSWHRHQPSEEARVPDVWHPDRVLLWLVQRVEEWYRMDDGGPAPPDGCDGRVAAAAKELKALEKEVTGLRKVRSQRAVLAFRTTFREALGGSTQPHMGLSMRVSH